LKLVEKGFVMGENAELASGGSRNLSTHQVSIAQTCTCVCHNTDNQILARNINC